MEALAATRSASVEASELVVGEMRKDVGKRGVVAEKVDRLRGLEIGRLADAGPSVIRAE